MTDRPDLEARLTRFLVEEAPPRAPERLIDASRRGVAQTSQSRRARLLSAPLWSAMLTPAGVAAAAVAIVTVVALASFSRSGPSVGTLPSPSASPSPAPSPSPSSCPSGQGTCLGLLQAGTYRSSSFLPRISYTVAGGWANTLDVRGELDLAYATGGQYTYSDGLTFRDGISFFRAPVAESTTSRTPLAGVGTTANDLARWLVGHADLVATTPTPVSMGGASGFRLTLSLPTGTRTAPDHCTTDHGEPRCASLFLSSDPAATYGFGLVGPETAVVYLLDTPSGDTVMIVIDDVDGVDQPKLEAAATPIVNSLSFAP
jgi:hypothetical protein